MSFVRRVIGAASWLFVIGWCWPAGGQLLHSWEGSLEGLEPSGGFTVVNTNGGPNTGLGVTDGVDSLEVTIPDEGFRRWGKITLGAQQVADLAAAAAEPLLFRIGVDVTYDTSFIPQGTVTFVNQQFAFQTDTGGWSQVDFALDTDGVTNETQRVQAPLVNFATVNSDTG